MKNYNVHYKMTFGLEDKVKTVETIVRLRAIDAADAHVKAFRQKTMEAADMNRPVYALVLDKVEEFQPKNQYEWITYKGIDVLRCNGGQSDYIEWSDNNIYSINGEFFFPQNKGQLKGVRWGLRREFDIHSESDDARHIFLMFDQKKGNV